MKKTFLGIALLLSAASGYSSITYPAKVWESDLQDVYYDNDGKIALPWLTYGTGAKPSKVWSFLFPDYADGPYYVLSNIASDMVAFSLSSFDPSQQADEWLVTPEFDVTGNNLLVGYKIFAQGSTLPSSFKILVAENGGSDKSDFSETPLVASTFKGSEDGVKIAHRYFALKGYDGKRIRLAFVNESTDTGVLGFGNIEVLPYKAEVINHTPQFINPGEEAQVRFTVNLATPETVSGFKAVLETSNGISQTYNSTKSYSTTDTQQKFSFPEKIRVEAGQTVNYTVTITPKKDGYEPIVITGAIAAGEPSFEPVALIEEFTGTWCGYCPRGACALEYYKNYYTGTDRPLVIGVAVHSGDVMQVTNNLYYEDLNSLSIAPNNLPAAMFNRQFCEDPANLTALDRMLSKKGYVKAHISDVECDLDSRSGVLSFDAALCIDMNNPEINAAVIVTENDVAGNNGDYSQTNYYYNANLEELTETYGEDLAQYFSFYVGRRSNQVPYTEMIYNDVARACYPSLTGKPMPTGLWTAGTSVEGSVDFSIPSSVADPGNVDLVLVLTDAVNGQVLCADRVSLFGSGVDSVATGSGINISREENALRISGACGALVEIYSIDGVKLLSAIADSDDFAAPAAGISGMVIVKVTSGCEVVSKKTVF